MREFPKYYDTYDPSVDYCGPEGHWTENFVSSKILGIDTNLACWEHDQGYKYKELKKEVDRRFWERQKSIILDATSMWNPKRYLALMIAYRRYNMVSWFGEEAYNG